MLFGFRDGIGTQEALFSLNVLTQRCRDMNVDVYACFIVFQKAFDCVNHEKIIEIIKATACTNYSSTILEPDSKHEHKLSVV